MAQIIEQTGGAAASGIASGIQQALQGELNLKHQKELDDYRAQLDLESAKQRMAIKEQFDIEAEARAYKIAIDKMEYASMIDFEQQEKERIRDIATFNAGIKSIDDNEGLTDAQRNGAKFNLAMKYTHIPEASQYLGLKPQGQDGFTNLPYYYQGAAPEKIAELNEAKRQTILNPEANITSMPWFLSPQFIDDPRAREERKSRGIILSDDEIRQISEEYKLKPISSDEAEAIYDEANGDLDKARKIAKERGLKL